MSRTQGTITKGAIIPPHLVESCKILALFIICLAKKLQDSARCRAKWSHLSLILPWYKVIFHNGESNRGPLACYAKTLQLELNSACFLRERSRRENPEFFTASCTQDFWLIEKSMLPSFSRLKIVPCITCASILIDFNVLRTPLLWHCLLRII